MDVYRFVSLNLIVLYSSSDTNESFLCKTINRSADFVYLICLSWLKTELQDDQLCVKSNPKTHFTFADISLVELQISLL
jgi:hypothetical protein